jgi:hypothetical protein
VRPFDYPQNAAGAVRDTIHLFGGNFFSGNGFEEAAGFSAAVRSKHVFGIARLRQTLMPSGVSCRSGRIRFRVNA